MSKRQLEGKKVLVLTETEYIPGEMDYYQTEFPKLGAGVDFACHLWGEPSRILVSDVTTPGERPKQMTVSLEVADLRAQDYDIIIQAANYTAVRLREIPPMHSHANVAQVRDPPAVKLFAEAMRDKRIIKGAMCHGLWILTPCPELLAGRRVMCHTVVLADIHNAGAVYMPGEAEVIVDDDLVTARSFANIEGYFRTLVSAAEARPPRHG